MRTEAPKWMACKCAVCKRITGTSFYYYYAFREMFCYECRAWLTHYFGFRFL
jgi:hypothetical protein